MSPSPPKHRKLIAQARYFRLVEIDQPEVCLLPDVTSLSFLLFPPLPLSGTSCNVQYSGSPQRETWSKSIDGGKLKEAATKKADESILIQIGIESEIP